MNEIVAVDKKQEGKTRNFQATLTQWVVSSLMKGYNTALSDDHLQPCYLQLCGDESSLKAVVANIKAGNRLYFPNRKSKNISGKRLYSGVHLSKSKYSYLWQYFEAGASVEIINNELFSIEPLDEMGDSFSFIALISQEWCDSQKSIIESSDPEIFDWSRKLFYSKYGEYENNKHMVFIAEHLVYFSSMFSLYVDRRTRVPIMPSLRFQVMLFLECANAGIVRFSSLNKAYNKTPVCHSGPLIYSSLQSYIQCIQSYSTQEAFEIVVARVVDQLER